MLDITAANTANLPTKAGPPQPKSYRLRKEALNAAVSEIGPHARDGFEFDTLKSDGRWIWKQTDEVPPPTGSELKAMGGKKAFLTTMATNPLGTSLASAVASALVDGASPEKRTSEAPASVADAADVEAGEAINTAALAAHPIDIPGFLRRENTTDAKKRAAKIVKETNPRSRKIKHPPDAKAAKTKAPNGVVVGETVAPAPKVKLAKGSSKTELIAALLTRKEGCTTADILAAVGWPSVSVPAMAKAAKLTLRKKKDGKVSRYWGKPATP
jgi:hypothetical protein